MCLFLRLINGSPSDSVSEPTLEQILDLSSMEDVRPKLPASSASPLIAFEESIAIAPSKNEPAAGEH